MSSDKLDLLLQQFTTFKSEVATAFANVETQLKQQNGLKELETSVKTDRSTEDNGQHVDTPVHSGERQSSDQLRTSAVSNTGFVNVETEPLQARFRAIKDSVANHRLADDLYFGGRPQGVDKTSREAANILSSTSKYIETALKLTGSLHEETSGDSGVQEKLDDLTVVLVACMRQLQEKQAGLVVAGTYGVKAKRMYDSLSSTNSNFGHPQILQRVEQAAKLASLAREDSSFPHQQHRGGFRGCPFSSSSWRGRGQSNFRGHGRGHSDFNPGFQSLPMPTEREESS